jgi:hypothetical protein
MNALMAHRFKKVLVSESGNASTGDVPTDKFIKWEFRRVIAKYLVYAGAFHQVN